MQITDQRTKLVSSLDRAGYYPAFVLNVVEVALAGAEVLSTYVHVETTFAGPEVKRHITVLALTPKHLVITHADDHSEETNDGKSKPLGSATSESVRLSAVRSVVLSHTVANPENYAAGDPELEVSLAIGWGAVSRIDLEPASCPDPNCEADHGLTGQVTTDDVMLRVSAQAEGAQAVRELVEFAGALTAVTGN